MERRGWWYVKIYHESEPDFPSHISGMADSAVDAISKFGEGECEDFSDVFKVEAEFHGTEVPVKPVDFHDEPHTGQE